MELYGYYLGIQVREVASGGMFSIGTADLAAVNPNLVSGPGGLLGISDGSLAVMDVAEDWGNSTFGDPGLGHPSWFDTAMHELGHNLGLGHTYDLPHYTNMGESASAYTPGGSELTYPGDNDIVHGQYLYRPDSNDIDMYQFVLAKSGTLSAETIAERLPASSLLNTVISIYDANKTLIARNDDYFGNDSYLKLSLGAGTYYVAVTAKGNTSFNPDIENTGIGGRTQGSYQLRLNFLPDRTDYLIDEESARATGRERSALDGDLDGRSGGVYDYWFDVQTAANTLFVDKDALVFDPGSPKGSLGNPYTKISDALTAAQSRPKDPANGVDVIVRVVGNLYFNDLAADPATLRDNVAYEVGYRIIGGTPLADGTKLEVPWGVTVLVDAGSVVKLGQANLDVGSSAQGLDRSLGSLQVLGTPYNSVYFTSQRDQALGVDTDPLNTTPAAGDWGGLVFRNNEDYNYPGRRVLEREGIFLNYVNHADIRYGGGQVNVNGLIEVYTPIHLAEARPTITFNTITRSGHAAISADPDSFEDTLFQTSTYTLDYDRVGPEIYGNIIKDNTTNALFVRIRTDAGRPLDRLTVPARFDDLDIVHMVAENFVLDGVPGGSLDGVGRINARLACLLYTSPSPRDS